MRSGRNSYVNFGVSYTKSRNFNQILTATGRLNGASQNKLSSMKNYNDLYRLEKRNGELTSQWGTNNNPDLPYNQVDYLYSNALLNDKNSQLVGRTDVNRRCGAVGDILWKISPTVILQPDRTADLVYHSL